MKKFTTDVFNSVLSLFEENKPIPTNSDLTSLVYSIIDTLIDSQKNHAHGMNFYVKNKFLFLKDVLPATATEEEFENLFSLCSTAKKLFKNIPLTVAGASPISFDLTLDAYKRQMREIGLGIYSGSY